MATHSPGESSGIPEKLRTIFRVFGREWPYPEGPSTPSSRKGTGMRFAAHPLRVAFEGRSAYGFSAWTDSTHDPVETVLEEGRFHTAGEGLHRGDRIFAGVSPRPANCPPVPSHRSDAAGAADGHRPRGGGGRDPSGTGFRRSRRSLAAAAQDPEAPPLAQDQARRRRRLTSPQRKGKPGALPGTGLSRTCTAVARLRSG